MWTIIESSADKNAHLPAFDEPLLLGTESPAHSIRKPLWLRLLRATAWMSGIVLLMLALAGQWLYVNRTQLLESPSWRAYWQALCQYADCDVPPAQNASALRSVLLVVDTHPERTDALQVRFRVQNTSQVPQKFPAVELSFTNTSNELVASRRFYPGHYLNREGFLMQHIRPAAEVDGLIEIINPGEDAVNYAIKFVYERPRH